MSIYLDADSINDLMSVRDKIFHEAQQVYAKYGIDVLANDTLSALSIHEIVGVYDPDYNTNFHRNAEDAKSRNVLIENKCATKQPNKKGLVGKCSWQFHAQGKLESDRYIFAVRQKDTLQIVRLWDISSTGAISAVQACLFAERQKWIDRGKPNHDAIVVPEKLLMQMPVVKRSRINGCEVIVI